VKLFLPITWKHTEGEDVDLHSFVTSVLDGDEWLTSSPVHFTPEKNTGTPWIEDWVGPRAGLGVLEKVNFFSPLGIRTPRKETINNSLISIFSSIYIVTQAENVNWEYNRNF